MNIKLIECPRDAMQGLHDFIPTETKVKYINKLLKVGFDTIDFGSFVSPKAIPQMQDTAEVLASLNLTDTKLLAIVANLRGANDAVKHNTIQYIGFPFSVSETFQMRNTNTSIAIAFDSVKQMQELCQQYNKTLVVYISMGFGNPYGDKWNVAIVEHWVAEMAKIGVKIISLSDTIGAATPQDITYLFTHLVANFTQVEFGAHLHTTTDTWFEKVDAAYNSGCRRFDGALKGFGGCPMAADKLTGNMPTENLVAYFNNKKLNTGVNMDLFNDALMDANTIFSNAV